MRCLAALLRPAGTMVSLAKPSTGNSLCWLAGAERSIDPPIERCDAFIEITETVKEFGDCLASRSGKAVLGILQNAWDLLARLTDMAGEDDASIAKRATNLARDAGAVVEEALAGPMQHLNILLLDGTLRYEAHARLSYCDANRLGVVAVFLFRRNGFTYCGLIMRRVWPKRSNSRAQ